MHKIIFVRHAMPEINKTQSANHWALSTPGRQASATLANNLAVYQPTRVITSVEPKAAETGQIIAQTLNLPYSTAVDLHEHDRKGVPYFEDRSDFEDHVRRFFDFPTEQIFGNETALAAYTRFAAAVDTQQKTFPNDTLIIATHGTVMALFLQQRAGIMPFPYWKAQPLPTYITLSLPDYRILGSDNPALNPK